MKYGGVLTQVRLIEQFAICRPCGLVYQDNSHMSGSLLCPKCRQPVERGLSRAMAKEMLDTDQKELLS